MSNLKIETIVVTPFSQNCRVLYHSEKKEAVVLDPGGDVQLILSCLSKLQVSCSEIWLTHSHIDHCGGVRELRDKSKAILRGHIAEKLMRQKIMEIAAMYGLPKTGINNCPEPDYYLQDNEILLFNEFKFQVLFTPGHSPGHVCFYCESERLLLGGDLIFYDSIGRTDLPGSNHQQLMTSIKSRVCVLPDDTAILVGHGPDTTISREKKYNPWISAGE